MNSQQEIGDAADDILERVKELDSPKDAVCAILTAHVKLTLDHGEEPVETILEAYTSAFKAAIG